MKRLFVAALGLVVGAALQAPANETGGAFKVIVNPRVAGKTIPREVIAQIYLGQVQRWGDGSVIAAVDLSSTSPVRVAFSATVLAMPVEAVKVHWLRSISTGGKRPPTTRQSDEHVIAFVAAEPGAIGYVSEAISIPSTVRVVEVR